MGDVFEAAPKVELHLHLEGAIPLETLWDLIVAHGGDDEVPDRDGLRRRLAYRDFPHFIDTWYWMTRFLDSPEAFTEAAAAVAHSLADQNIVYAEASFSPSDFARHGLSPQELATAIRKGLDRVAETSVTLNVDLVRDAGPERCMRTLQQVAEVKDEAGVRGITIGGSEQRHPPHRYAEVYRRADRLGFRRTAHAGEAAGAESVWGALRTLGVERIGHGVRSVEDPELVSYLATHRIPLEVCPTSNIRTGVVTGWDDHPVFALLDAGANVTVNSDDPALFDCTLAGDFRELAARGGADMEALTLAAVDASWLDDADRSRLRAQIAAWWAASG